MDVRASALRPELPFKVAELPPSGAEARQLHAGGGQDHLRDVQKERKLVSEPRTEPISTALLSSLDRLIIR